MKRAFVALTLWAACTLPAAADLLPLSAISSYLEGIGTLEAPFSQTNSDGSTSSGTLFIDRPNRMRFEYAPPEQTLVLSSGGQVAIFDGKSNVEPEQYPLKRTPLNLILAPKIDLGRAKMVTGHAEADDRTVVVAQDPDNPQYGSIALYFSADPVALREWIVTDEYGSQTTVELGRITLGRTYPASRFSINFEADARRRN